MSVQVFTHSENELNAAISKAVEAAFKNYREQTKPDNTLLTQKEAAQLLTVSIPTLQRMKEKGIIPFSQIERKIYFRKQDILNAINAQMAKASRG